MARAENIVEKYLHSGVASLGGTTRKWVSPGRDGVMDRICFLHGFIFFVEVKTLNGKLTTRQTREADELRRHGAVVYTVYGTEDVDRLIEELRKR